MVRLFVGLSLPEDLRNRLAALSGGLPGARWTPVEKLHLTLRFIGEVDEPRADAIDQALSAIRAGVLKLTVGGLDTFDQTRGRYGLWVGVHRDERLDHLHGKIERAVVAAGMPAERRRFHPHITLARLTNPSLPRLQAFIAGHNLFEARAQISHFTLFSSHLGHGDPVYRAECDYPLKRWPGGMMSGRGNRKPEGLPPADGEKTDLR